MKDGAVSLRNLVCHHLTYSVGRFFWGHQQGGDYIAGFSVSSNPSFWCLYLCKTIFFLYLLDAKVQDHFNTTKPEVENENADSHWKGAVTSCVGSVKNPIFNAEHWSTFLLFFSVLRLYHIPNLMCLLTEVQINCSCGDWFNDNDDPCLSGPGLRPAVHFYATKQLKDVLCSALACAASKQMSSRQVSVPYCNALEPWEVFKPDPLTIPILSMSRETTR